MCLTLQGEQFPGGGGRVCRWGLILQVRRHHPCGKSMQSLLVAVTLKRPYAGSSVYEHVCVRACMCVGDTQKQKQGIFILPCSINVVPGHTFSVENCSFKDFVRKKNYISLSSKQTVAIRLILRLGDTNL